MNASSRSMFLLTSRTSTTSGRRLVAGFRKLPNHTRTCSRSHHHPAAAVPSTFSMSSSCHLPDYDSTRHSLPSWRSLSSSAAPQRIEHSYETQCSPKVENVFQKILDLDMFEIHLVTELIAEKVGLNFNAAAMAAGGVGGGAGGGGAAVAGAAEEAAEEKTAFDLKLISFDAKAKIKVIKEVRSIAGLGLKEAKELVEGAPKTILKEMKKEELEGIAAKMKELGAEVEIV